MDDRVYHNVTVNFCVQGNVEDFLVCLDARVPGDEYMNATERHGGSGDHVRLDSWTVLTVDGEPVPGDEA